jgi:hypothetical protein
MLSNTIITMEKPTEEIMYIEEDCFELKYTNEESFANISKPSSKEELIFSSYSFGDLNNFSPKTYNGLSNVLDADKNLKKVNDIFVSFLYEFTKLNSSEFALRLIHNHMSLDEGEIMIEKFEIFNNKPAMITRKGKIANGVYPASWLVNSDGTLSVFEYSTDSYVGRVINNIVKDPHILGKVCELILKYELESLLSPCIHVRDSIVKFNKNQPFLEITYDDLGISVVQNKIIEPNNQTVIIETLYGTCKENACCHVCRHQVVYCSHGVTY